MFLPLEVRGQRSLEGYSPWVAKTSTEQPTLSLTLTLAHLLIQGNFPVFKTTVQPHLLHLQNSLTSAKELPRHYSSGQASRAARRGRRRGRHRGFAPAVPLAGHAAPRQSPKSPSCCKSLCSRHLSQGLCLNVCTSSIFLPASLSSSHPLQPAIIYKA